MTLQRSDGERPALRRIAGLPWPMLAIVCVLAALGFLTLLSVGGTVREPLAELHAVRFSIGMAVLIAIAAVPSRHWHDLAWVGYVLAAMLLAFVLVVGSHRMGAQRWIAIGGLVFQPSDLMKLALVPALARYYQWLPAGRRSRPLWVAIPLLVITLPVALTLRQPDLGTAVLLTLIGLAIMFLAGVSWLWFGGGAASVAMTAPLIWAGMHDYQRRRVTAFLAPEQDLLGAGYHLMQSKIAIGSGGLLGKGYFEGTQSRLGFLPEAHTDFVFAAFAEETGLLGTLLLLALYGLLGVTLLVMCTRCRSPFARLTIGGYAIAVVAYAMVNIAMVSGVLPVVGVPLPFMSHGGTAMATTMIGFGIACSCWIDRDRARPEMPPLVRRVTGPHGALRR